MVWRYFQASVFQLSAPSQHPCIFHSSCPQLHFEVVNADLSEYGVMQREGFLLQFVNRFLTYQSEKISLAPFPEKVVLEGKKFTVRENKQTGMSLIGEFNFQMQKKQRKRNKRKIEKVDLSGLGAPQQCLEMAAMLRTVNLLSLSRDRSAPAISQIMGGYFHFVFKAETVRQLEGQSMLFEVLI